MTAKEKVIDVASGEVGYLEKASHNHDTINDKTANAGSGNYTKYWCDLKEDWNGLYWCAIFICWCFVTAFGKDMAKKLLGHYPYTYCPTLANMTTNKTPKVGSIVLFWSATSGTWNHTGLVIEVTDSYIITIEGNTSSQEGTVIPNGGGVFRKKYARSKLSSGNRYYMPNYSLVDETTSDQKATVTTSQTSTLCKVKPKEDLYLHRTADLSNDSAFHILKPSKEYIFAGKTAKVDGKEMWYVWDGGELLGWASASYLAKI